MENQQINAPQLGQRSHRINEEQAKANFRRWQEAKAKGKVEKSAKPKKPAAPVPLPMVSEEVRKEIFRLFNRGPGLALAKMKRDGLKVRQVPGLVEALDASRDAQEKAKELAAQVAAIKDEFLKIFTDEDLKPGQRLAKSETFAKEKGIERDGEVRAHLWSLRKEIMEMSGTPRKGKTNVGGQGHVKGPSGGGKDKQTSNPAKAAKKARKLALRKKGK